MLNPDVIELHIAVPLIITLVVLLIAVEIRAARRPR